jgi:uncharacterized cupin superfamily protein
MRMIQRRSTRLLSVVVRAVVPTTENARARIRVLISHWDDAETDRAELGHLAGTWTDLAAATGARRIGVNRIQVDPERWSTPAHLETAEEEIFFVLDGSGWSWQQLGAHGAVRMHEIGPGDCIVHRAGAERHTLLAGSAGLDVIAFGNHHPTQFGYLPRAQVSWLGGTWTNAGDGDWPWAREVAAGTPEIVDATDRPENIKRDDDVEPVWEGQVFALAHAAGSQQSGLNLTKLPPGGEGAPPHCHSAEDEFFVVLGGEGTLHVDPTPTKLEFGGQGEKHSLRRGHVASFPAGANVCHSISAGDAGLTFLAYGTRQPHDVIYYARRNALFFKGVGVMVPVEHIGFLES